MLKIKLWKVYRRSTVYQTDGLPDHDLGGDRI